jgi:hypothetical protein
MNDDQPCVSSEGGLSAGEGVTHRQIEIFGECVQNQVVQHGI